MRKQANSRSKAMKGHPRACCFIHSFTVLSSCFSTYDWPCCRTREVSDFMI